MSEMKVEIRYIETSKPSSPTPDHLKTLNLSFYDVMTPPVYTGGLFFYTSTDNSNNINETSQKLKQSLSETLTRFYPFAGRINDRVIDCNDEGAVFIEAKVDFVLSDVLKNPKPSSLLNFLPHGRPKAGMWPLLLVQATFFTCGGFVIGICLSHRVSDVSALSMFIKGWSAAANGRPDAVAPTFTAAQVFPSPPGQETIKIPEDPEDDPAKPRFVAKRFLFNASKIKELKNRGMSESVKDPTRFEAITSLLWISATKARRSNSDVLKPSMLQLPVDIRRRKMSPLISENSIGNIISVINIELEEPQMDFKSLVAKLRMEKKEASEKLHSLKPMEIAEGFEKMIGEFFYKKIVGVVDGYSSTSWGGSGFYVADLGFGNPIWVTPDSFNTEINLFILLDTRDGVGIEAWVNLTEEDMFVFEKDQELLEFVTVNPSVEV